MEKILKVCIVLFCPMLFFGQNKITVIEYADLSTKNCGKAVKDLPLKKNEMHLVSISFSSEQQAQQAASNYSLEKEGQLLSLKVTVSGIKLIFDNPYPFQGLPDATIKINYKVMQKTKKSSQCVYSFSVSRDTKDGSGADGGKNDGDGTKIDYTALAATLKYTLDLRDLYPSTGSCCEDDIYPCLDMSVVDYIKIISDPLIIQYEDRIHKLNNVTIDDKKGPTDVDGFKALIAARKQDVLKLSNEGRKIKNRLIYDAKINDVYWFDSDGRPNMLSKKKHKYFEVKAGDNIAFEIINVNPSSYKTSIDQSSVSIWQDANDMLLRYLVPFKTADGTAAGAGPAGSTTVKKIDKVRAAVLLISKELADFQDKLLSSCDNLHFKLIDSKTKAKQRIDNFLVKDVGKLSGLSFDQFMQSELDIKKADSTLYKVAKRLYNLLPASSYHMEYLTRAKYDKDRIDFKYSILAQENTPFMNKAKEETIPVYIVGNFKVDVSTGLYYGWLKDDVYNLRDTISVVTNGTVNDTLKYKKIIKDRPNSGEFGFSSYLHFYRKNRPSFSWGGHIGVGLSLNNQVKPRYFTGLSFLLGRESGRIAINLGIAAGNVDQISDVYRKDDTNSIPGSDYSLLSSTETSIKYVSKFSVQPAVGVSYNIPFSLSKKTQPAPEISGEKGKTSEAKKEEPKTDNNKPEEAKPDEGNK